MRWSCGWAEVEGFPPGWQIENHSKWKGDECELNSNVEACARSSKTRIVGTVCSFPSVQLFVLPQYFAQAMGMKKKWTWTASGNLMESEIETNRQWHLHPRSPIHLEGSSCGKCRLEIEKSKNEPRMSRTTGPRNSYRGWSILAWFVRSSDSVFSCWKRWLSH